VACSPERGDQGRIKYEPLRIADKGRL